MADPLDLGIPKQFQTDVETVHWVSQVNTVLIGNKDRTSLATDIGAIGGSYSQSDLQAIADKVDAILLALQGG